MRSKPPFQITRKLAPIGKNAQFRHRPLPFGNAGGLNEPQLSKFALGKLEGEDSRGLEVAKHRNPQNVLHQLVEGTLIAHQHLPRSVRSSRLSEDEHSGIRGYELFHHFCEDVGGLAPKISLLRL